MEIQVDAKETVLAGAPGRRGAQTLRKAGESNQKFPASEPHGRDFTTVRRRGVSEINR
jgi:hypothetical protein